MTMRRCDLKQMFFIRPRDWPKLEISQIIPKTAKSKRRPKRTPGFWMYTFWGAHTLGDIIHIWVWVNTYRYIFSGMNIHLPAILGFTRCQGFDPSPYFNFWGIQHPTGTPHSWWKTLGTPGAPGHGARTSHWRHQGEDIGVDPWNFQWFF